MKLAKSQLSQIIKEELNSALKELDDQPVLDAPAAAEEGPKMKTPVQRAAKKIEAVPGLDKILDDINDRIKLEQFLKFMLQNVDTDTRETLSALAKAHRAVLASSKKEG